MLIYENDDGIDLSLYIAADVIQQLENSSPSKLIADGKYKEYCLLLEGVSHFLYVVWNASFDKKITRLEMELQADIDKFICLQSYFDFQDFNVVSRLCHYLFVQAQFDSNLTDSEFERYSLANNYAKKYCKGLQQRYRLNKMNSELLNELRRFYRLSREDKLRYINKLH